MNRESLPKSSFVVQLKLCFGILFIIFIHTVVQKPAYRFTVNKERGALVSEVEKLFNSPFKTGFACGFGIKTGKKFQLPNGPAF